MKKRRLLLFVIVSAGLLLLHPVASDAHCDSMDGPVITTARIALENGDVAPVLKWVPAADEKRVRDAFAQAMKVRALSPDARELADRYFFETLVRIHRAGEGAPYDGLKPAGTIPSPIAAADRSLEERDVDGLVTLLSKHVEEGLRMRFERAVEAGAHVGDSVEAGRAFVAAYVEYIHFVENLHEAIESGPHAHDRVN